MFTPKAIANPQLRFLVNYMSAHFYESGWSYIITDVKWDSCRLQMRFEDKYVDLSFLDEVADTVSTVYLVNYTSKGDVTISETFDSGFRKGYYCLEFCCEF